MSSKNSPGSLTHWGLTQSSRAEFAGPKGTPFLDLFPRLLCKATDARLYSSSYLTINFPVGKAELFNTGVNGPLLCTERTASLRSRVRSLVKKAIMCEESNAGKHSGPNLITGTGKFHHYFVLSPGLVSLLLFLLHSLLLPTPLCPFHPDAVSEW